MSVQQEIPSELDSLFRNLDKTYSKAEAATFITELKRNQSETPDVEYLDLYGALKNHYYNGQIDENDDDPLSVLECMVQSKRNELALRSIQDCKTSLPPSKGKQLIGREEDIDNILQSLSDPQVHGIILFGAPGVGKTSFAKDVGEKLKSQSVSTDLIELKGITNMADLYIRVLTKFEISPIPRNGAGNKPHTDNYYNIMSFDRKEIMGHLEKKCSKTLLILDNIEEELFKIDNNELKEFVQSLNACKVLKNGTVKLIFTTSMDVDINLPFVKNQRIDPLSEESSMEFLAKRLLDERREEKSALNNIAAHCRGISYLIQGMEQMLRDHFRSPAEVLRKIELQIENKIPKEYACLGAMFESISKPHLKELAVKMSLLTGPFSVETATKIAEISDYEAIIDLETLHKHKIIEKVPVEEKVYYEIHSLFQDFVTLCLILRFPHFMKVYESAKQQFVQHFLDKLHKIAESIDTDFIKTFEEFEKDKVNLDTALHLMPTMEGMIERFLPSKDHEYRLLLLIESLKDLKERRKLFKTWADAFEREEKWLPSANMRCWQASQLADAEGTKDSERILNHAEKCLNKALEDPASDPLKLKDGKALSRLVSGKLAYMQSANLLKNESKRRQELSNEALRKLDGALGIYRELYQGNHTMIVRTLNLQGNSFMELDDLDQAEEVYQKALQMKIELTGSENHCDIAMLYGQLSQVHERRGIIKEEKRARSWNPWNWIPSIWSSDSYNNDYETACDLLKISLKLDEHLHLNNFLGTATSKRNLANVLIGLKQYDKALRYATESYTIRKELLDVHPETVRILYLIGIIHEWRKDYNAALKSFEEAFLMEESLPQENHSIVRKILCYEFERMCKKCKDKEKLEKYDQRIKRLDQLIDQAATSDERSRIPDETPIRSAPMTYLAEAKSILVNQNGGIYEFESFGILLSIPPGAVCNQNEITIQLITKDSLPSPAGDLEAVVSFIVDLGPCDLVLQKSILVTMVHSGSTRIGYENIVMAFNKSEEIWEEVQEFHSKYPQGSPQFKCSTEFIEIHFNKLTTLAVISRLITDTFEVPSTGCIVKSSVYPQIILHFPEGSVNRTIKGYLKVLAMPDVIPTDIDACLSPMVIVDGFEHIKLSKPVTLTLPHPCPENYSRGIVHVFQLNNEEWKEITDDVRYTESKFSIALQIKHFSKIWLWLRFSQSAILTLAAVVNLFWILKGLPQRVRFAAYKLKKLFMDESKSMKLTLRCMAANHSMLPQEGYEHLAEETGKREMMPQQTAYINVEGTFKKTEDVQLQFCGGYDVDEKELVIEENKNTDHTQQEPKIVIRFFTKSSSEQVDEQSTNSSSERVDNLANLTIFERQLKECTSLDPHSQDVYKMTSSPRGLIVIINMETFSDSSLPQRIGSEKDVEELEKLFGPEYLGFEVKIMKNLKGFDLWQNINPIFTNENNAYERFDSLAICLMSHGKEGRVVFAADGDEINVEEIFSKFSNTECAAFRYKPKLFIIQACRGIRGDPTQEQPPVVAFLAKSYPPVDKSDIIIANSSYEGYSSFRDKNNGCFFIQTLVKVFKEYADKEQVCEMLQRVTDKVNLRLQDGMTTRTQVPTVESTLTKKLYFWPRKKFKI